MIRWNPAAERIFGWSPEEILGRPVPIVRPAKQAEFEGVLSEVISRMSEGRSNEALAREMNLSERAVEAHVADIFTKLALPPTGDDRRRMLAMLLSRS